MSARESRICSEIVGRGPVGRKIMIHSGQIPTLFLTDKILKVVGSVYHETREREKKEKNTREGSAMCGRLSMRGNRRGKVFSVAAYGTA